MRVITDVLADMKEIVSEIGRINEIVNRSDVEPHVMAKAKADAKDNEQRMRAANDIVAKLQRLWRQLMVLPGDSVVELSESETSLFSYARIENEKKGE